MLKEMVIAPSGRAILWEGIVKVDPSISTHLDEAVEDNGQKVITITDNVYPYQDNAQLDNPGLADDFPNKISLFVKGAEILEYMNCSVFKGYRSGQAQKGLFRRQEYPNKKVITKGFVLSPVTGPRASLHHTGCLASIQVCSELSSSLVFEQTGIVAFASGSKTSNITFRDPRSSATIIFVASDKKPFVAYITSKKKMLKLLCDSNGIRTDDVVKSEEATSVPTKQRIEDPVQILKTRLAKGEISIEEYHKLKRIIDNERLDPTSNWI